MSIKLKKLFLLSKKFEGVLFIDKSNNGFYNTFLKNLKIVSKLVYYMIPFKIRHGIQEKFIIKQYKNYSDFHSVYFELRTKCNSRCNFCKASIHTEDRPDITMNFKLYEKIINELAHNQYNGNISFFVNNEPFLVKDLKKFIEYASLKLPNSNLKLLSNGIKLNYISGKEIFDSGLTELEINWYLGNTKQNVSNGIKNFEDKFLKNDLKISKVNYYNAFKYKGKQRYYYKLLRHIGEKLNSRGGSSPNWKDNELIYDGFCSYPFWQINIKADGSVGQCCADFYLDNTKLNANFLSIYEIWNSDFFKNLRYDLLKGDRSKNNLCKKCDFFGENFRRSESKFGKFLSAILN